MVDVTRLSGFVPRGPEFDENNQTNLSDETLSCGLILRTS